MTRSPKPSRPRRERQRVLLRPAENTASDTTFVDLFNSGPRAVRRLSAPAPPPDRLGASPSRRRSAPCPRSHRLAPAGPRPRGSLPTPDPSSPVVPTPAQSHEPRGTRGNQFATPYQSVYPALFGRLNNQQLASLQLQNELNATLQASPEQDDDSDISGGSHENGETSPSRAERNNQLTPVSNTRQHPRHGATATSSTQDSYPGPFRRLPEYTIPESHASIQVQKGRDLARPVSPVGSDDTFEGFSPEPEVIQRHTPPAEQDGHFERNSPVSAQQEITSEEDDSEEFPDGDLDLDLDDSNLPDIYDDDVQNEALVAANNERIRLEEALEGANQDRVRLQENLRLLGDETQQQLEVAQIELDMAREELEERNDAVLQLQQQLAESKSGEKGSQDEDHEFLAETNDVNLARIESLKEQLIEANEIADDLQRQLTESMANATAARNNDNHNVGTSDDADMIKALIAEEDTLNEKLRQCNEHRADREEEIEELRRQVDWFTANRAEREDADHAAALKDLRDQLEARDTEHAEEINKLGDQIFDYDKELQEALKIATDSEAAFDEAVADLRASEQRLRDCEGRNDSNVDRPRTVEPNEALQECRDQVADLERELDEARTKHQQMNERVGEQFDKMWQRLYTSDRALASERRLTARLRQQIANSGEEDPCSDVRRERDAAIMERDSARSDFDDSLRRIDEMQRDSVEAGDDEEDAHHGEVDEQEGTVEDNGEELELLRGELESAREEIVRLHGVIEAAREEDELPRAKRARKSSSEIDIDYEDGEEEVDEPLTPSSFLESEPSPLTPRRRRSGRTRRESQRLSDSWSVESVATSGTNDDEETRFRREVATTRPSHPRALIPVIDRAEVARARKLAAKSNASKRKR